jgi:hypothetical protein
VTLSEINPAFLAPERKPSPLRGSNNQTNYHPPTVMLHFASLLKCQTQRTIVGWICAITTEYVPAQAFLDEKHGGPAYLPPRNENNYTLGKIEEHNVFLSVLPIGLYGMFSAPRVAEDMLAPV